MEKLRSNAGVIFVVLILIFVIFLLVIPWITGRRSETQIQTTDQVQTFENLATPEPTVTTTFFSTPESTTAPTTVSGETIHIVKDGENLTCIGEMYGCSSMELATYNQIADPNRIDIGQHIRIPGNCVGYTGPPPQTAPINAEGTHVVQPGQNLFRIGQLYGCSIGQMAAANGLANPNKLDIGQVLKVPICNLP